LEARGSDLMSDGLQLDVKSSASVSSVIPVRALISFWESIGRQNDLPSTPSTKLRRKRSLLSLKRRTKDKKQKVQSPPAPPPDTVVYTVRHGERLDHVDLGWGKNAGRPFDAPLSERGQKQAREAGEKLAREKANIVAIYSSPFYRTLQTATLIQKVLQSKLKTRIPLYLEPAIAESIRGESVTAWEEKEKREFPGMKILAREDLKKEFEDVDHSHQSASDVNFPETEEQLFQRICRVVEKLPIEGKEILLVSHQIPVEYLVFELCAGKAQDKYVSYCCLSKVRKKPGQRHFTVEYQHVDDFLSEPERGKT